MMYNELSLPNLVYSKQYHIKPILVTITYLDLTNFTNPFQEMDERISYILPSMSSKYFAILCHVL